MQILRASGAVQTEVPCPYLQIRRNWFSSYQQMVPSAQHSQSVGHLRKSTAQKAAPFSQAVFRLPELFAARLQSRITVLELGTQLLTLICKEGLKHCLSPRFPPHPHCCCNGRSEPALLAYHLLSFPCAFCQGQKGMF